MCTLLIWKHCHPRFPFIVAANRDEFLDRPTTGPQSIDDGRIVIAGRDLVAGGTWLGVNSSGAFAALTNRRGAGAHDPSKSSRGLLVIDALRAPSFADALRCAAAIDARLYNPFALVLADRDAGAVVHAGADGIRVRSIDDGAHALTNWDLDADEPAKAAFAKHAAASFEFHPSWDARAIAQRLQALLALHAAQPEESLCSHRPQSNFGTRSATVVCLGDRPENTSMFCAAGPPCTAGLVEVPGCARHETHEPVTKSQR